MGPPLGLNSGWGPHLRDSLPLLCVPATCTIFGGCTSCSWTNPWAARRRWTGLPAFSRTLSSAAIACRLRSFVPVGKHTAQGATQARSAMARFQGEPALSLQAAHPPPPLCEYRMQQDRHACCMVLQDLLSYLACDIEAHVALPACLRPLEPEAAMRQADGSFERARAGALSGAMPTLRPSLTWDCIHCLSGAVAHSFA